MPLPCPRVGAIYQQRLFGIRAYFANWRIAKKVLPKRQRRPQTATLNLLSSLAISACALLSGIVTPRQGFFTITVCQSII
jgi:hypothetical protein